AVHEESVVEGHLAGLDRAAHRLACVVQLLRYGLVGGQKVALLGLSYMLQNTAFRFTWDDLHAGVFIIGVIHCHPDTDHISLKAPVSV
ncbi:hypothetical protein EGW08_000874, partial [Elysia chlorotica]